MKHFLKETIKIIVILAIAIPTFAFLAGSWSEPIQSPPGTNVDAPINVGVQAQTKEGGLWLNTLGAAVGLIVDKGNVGIGVVSPTEKLDIDGNIKTTGGLKIGNTNDTDPGTIRWTGSDFEGYDGSAWVSLTSGGETVVIISDATDCDNAGGDWQNAQSLCYFQGTSCASGWKSKESYNSSSSGSCSGASDRTGACSGSPCSTGSHSRVNSGMETCSYTSMPYTNYYFHHHTCSYQSRNCTATQTEVGCVKN